MTNAERIVEQYVDGYYTGHKGDQLRLKDNVIYSQGTPIGYFIETDEEYGDEYDEYINNKYLVLTMTNYKSQKNWKTHKKQLAEAAMNAGIFVIFIPEIDIGFGALLHIDEQSITDNLLEIAKYSNDNDIKTACVVIPLQNDKPYIFTFNQIVNSEVYHAEQILCEYLRTVYNSDNRIFISLLEPCYECLGAMMEQEGTSITYYYPHKEKWNTQLYIQRVNDIQSKRLRVDGIPIKYKKLNDTKVNKFYEKEKK